MSSQKIPVGNVFLHKRKLLKTFCLPLVLVVCRTCLVKDDVLVSKAQCSVINVRSCAQVLQGNSDSVTPVRSMFHQPIRARYVRIHPVTWQGRITLRFELQGCFESYPTGEKRFRSFVPSYRRPLSQDANCLCRCLGRRCKRCMNICIGAADSYHTIHISPQMES